MIGVAFCPAHITGFFGATISESPYMTGSVGAGFCIQDGVTTTVRKGGPGEEAPGAISAYVAKIFLDATGNRGHNVGIWHHMGVPPGYGLGSSGAVALSTAYALDAAFGTKLETQELAQMAHAAEIRHKTGLGDVMAAYHGGFEVRTKAGAPGYGKLERLQPGKPSVVIICISPVSTSAFWKGRLALMNGTGERMVSRLLRRPDTGLFQRMSMEFAERGGVVTPAIRRVAAKLQSVGADCGVAMLGETAFTMIPQEDEERVVGILEGYDIMRTRISHQGARVVPP